MAAGRSRRSPGAGGGRRKRAATSPEPASQGLVILNPAAGGGKARRKWARLSAELRYWRLQPEVVETEAAGHGAELARAAAAAGASVVVAAGGDGTAHEVLQGLMEVDASHTGTAFAHLPLGTGCDLASALGLPGDPRGLLRRLRNGRNTYIDVGVAEMAGPQGEVRRYFLNAANVGLGPAVARRVQSSKHLQKLGKPSYVLASLRELLAARPYTVSWQTDDGHSGEMAALNFFICNGPSLAGGMRPCPAATLTDGTLHVAIVGALSLPAAIAQMHRLSRGRPFDHPDISGFTCRSIHLDGPEIDVETDGEIAGRLPAGISVRPGGLLIRMPGQ